MPFLQVLQGSFFADNIFNMIYMYFFLKFKSQLRRTRPEIVRQLDESMIHSITDAGGKVTEDRSLITAVFNEEKTGFWLDVYILIENLRKKMEKSNEFFGYVLVINNETLSSPESLCRFLTGITSGVFFSVRIVKKFLPYAFFEKPAEWVNKKKTFKYGSGRFFRIKELKIFKSALKMDQSFQNKVIEILEQSQGRNTLILGQAFSQICAGLNKYCDKINKGFPVLNVNFGSIGLGALVDIWSFNIRSLSAEQSTEEIDSLWELLFRDRIRDEISDYIVRSVKRFLSLILDFYFTAARKKHNTPFLILENINLAGKNVIELLYESLSDINKRDKQKLIILGTGEDDIPPDRLEQWEMIFTDIIKVDNESQEILNFPKLPAELWEIVYAISLFGRYFSPELFHRLFEEDEINPVMITRALSILYSSGIIDNPREPRPLNRYFEEYALKILEDKTARVNAMVRRRLLSWAVRRNINPCFRLLTIIAAMDGIEQIDDLMLLKSILSDVSNETVSGLETAINNGQLKQLVISGKAATVKYIYETSRALHIEDEKNIDKIFLEPPEDYLNSRGAVNDVLTVQITVNQCGYYLGRHNKAAAAKKAKEAILLGQNKNTFCIPQAYRLFSLICLSKQQVTETIEYLNFALTSAEKSSNYYEIGITAYYAAAAQFLHGNIYIALKHVKRSIEQSLAAGSAEWADRSRFLEGRLKFELGYYREAHDIFNALYKRPFGDNTEEKSNLFAAWIYRSKVYFFNPKISKPEPANYDADLFEIEASYLAGEYERAVRLSEALSNPFSKDSFLYTEKPVWSSGFAQCEHLYFSQGEIQDRMIGLFHSLAICHISIQGEKDAMQGIQQILRNEQFSEMDPWDAFYCYAKYRILKQTGASIVDMSTAVSMAFKRLQRRAGRIEDIKTRRQYLNGPRWNRELCLAAKEFKLI